MCNLTIGIYSVKPYADIDVIDGNARFVLPIAKSLIEQMKISNLRLIYKKIGELSDPDLLNHLDSGDVEVLPYLNFLSQLPSSFEASPTILGCLVKMMSISSEEKYEPSDWINIFGTLEGTLWLGISIVLLVISLILLRRNKNFRIRRNPIYSIFNIFWSILVAFLQQSPISKRFKWPKVLLLSFSMFIFFVLAYFSGQINTDLVNGIKPFQIDSMEDILLPEAASYRPVWRKAGMLQKFFQESSPDSVHGKIWKKAISMGIEDSLMTDSIPEVVSRMNEIVIFDADLFAKLVDHYSCLLFEKTQKFHISKNSAGAELLVVPVKLYNDSCSSHKRKSLYEFLRGLAESGHSKMLVGSKNVYLDQVGRSMGVAKCTEKEKTNKIQKTFQKVTMENIPLLFALCGVLICFGAIILFMEILIKNSNQYKAVKWKNVPPSYYWVPHYLQRGSHRSYRSFRRIYVY